MLDDAFDAGLIVPSSQPLLVRRLDDVSAIVCKPLPDEWMRMPMLALKGFVRLTDGVELEALLSQVLDDSRFHEAGERNREAVTLWKARNKLEPIPQREARRLGESSKHLGGDKEALLGAVRPGNRVIQLACREPLTASYSARRPPTSRTRCISLSIVSLSSTFGQTACVHATSNSPSPTGIRRASPRITRGARG